MRRIAEGWTVSFTRGAPPARSTSLAATLPSGPLPFNDARSIFFSLAILLAAGDAAMRPVGKTVVTGRGDRPVAPTFGVAFGVFVGFTGIVADFASPSLVAVSPGATIMAIFSPTGISSPAPAVTFAKM